MCDCDAPGGENMNYMAATEILYKSYLAKSGPDIYAVSEVIILHNDQHQHQKTISTNNTVNKLGCLLSDEHTLFNQHITVVQN